MNDKLLAPALLGALLVCACGKKTAPPQAEAAAPAAAAPEATPSPPPDVPPGPAPKITIARPRWIAVDSDHSAEIVLQGEYLDEKAYVASGSPLLRIMRLERTSTQTIVFAELDEKAPAGAYELQYLAPGRDPIPITVRYDGRKRP